MTVQPPAPHSPPAPAPGDDPAGSGAAARLSICFLSTAHKATDRRVFEKEAVSLAAAGFRVTHLCPGETEDARTLKFVRVRTYRRRPGLAGRVAALPRLYRLARAEAADVHHANEVDSWAIAVLLRVLRRARCVFDVHEHYPSAFAQSRFPRWMQGTVAAAVRLAFRLMTPFTDRIVLAKRTVAEDFPGAEARMVLVRNYAPRPVDLVADGTAGGVADGRADGTADGAAASHAEGAGPGAPLRLVHLGVFSRPRGWPQILDAMALARADLSLEIVGTINDGSEADFRARAAALGLGDRVAVTGWLPFDAAFRRLLEADVGLVAFQPGFRNHVYAMPHKLFDYMAAGLPVLLPAEAVEVAPVVAETGCGFLVDPADPADMAARLDWLAGNRQAARAMGRRGREAVRARFNWETEAERLIAMYREMERDR